MRKRTRTSMKREADHLWSRLIRSAGECRAKGWEGIPCSPVLQAAHVVPRRYLAVRWNPENGLCLCGAHHAFYTHFPLEFARFVGVTIGAEKFEALQRKAMEPHPKPDYEWIIESLKSEVPA